VGSKEREINETKTHFQPTKGKGTFSSKRGKKGYKGKRKRESPLKKSGGCKGQEEKVGKSKDEEKTEPARLSSRAEDKRHVFRISGKTCQDGGKKECRGGANKEGELERDQGGKRGQTERKATEERVFWTWDLHKEQWRGTHTAGKKKERGEKGKNRKRVVEGVRKKSKKGIARKKARTNWAFLVGSHIT